MAQQKIRIVTDSVADLPPHILEKHNIGVIPCYVNYGGGSYADDGKELDRHEFYATIREMKEFPTTAAPPPALAEELLHTFIEGYDAAVVVNVAGKLSATYNNARLGAESLGDRVVVLDSDTLSLAEGMQALLAAETAEATGDLEAVIDAVRRVRENQKLFAAFATMEFLRRSGRVNDLVATVGSLLQIKPIVDVYDGAVNPAARVRTFKKAISRMEAFARDHAPFARLGVLHVTNEDGAYELVERMSDLYDPAKTIISEAGPTLGTHIGPGALGITLIREGWDR